VLPNILQRTIFCELARVFALSLLGITGILVMAGIIAEAQQQGLSPAQLLAAIPLLVPSMLPYTIPPTTLFAACVVYGRLSADNEILAIKAAGVNVMKVVRPGLFLGLAMSVGTMALYYGFIPYTHRMLRAQVLNEVQEYLYAMLRKDHYIKQPGLPYCIWARQVQGKRLVDAIFKRKGKDSQHYDVTARAREAELDYDPVNRQVLVKMKHCDLLGENNENQGHFQEKTWEVPLPADYGSMKNIRPRDMSVPGLLDRLQELKAQIEAKQAEIAITVAWNAMSNPPTNLPDHIRHLHNKCHQEQLEVYSVETELHSRPGLAFGCFCFVLVGCPVGIWFSRSDYLSAFITCFLPIVFLYYPVVLCCTNLTKQGKLPPYLAVWAANAAVGIIGLVLFRRLVKH
jgi:lipopolysaccharide export system permease protein